MAQSYVDGFSGEFGWAGNGEVILLSPPQVREMADGIQPSGSVSITVPEGMHPNSADDLEYPLSQDALNNVFPQEQA